MLLLAGKFLHGTKLELQSRLFLIPWVKKNLVRSCSKDSDTSSVFPVKYIPKNSSKTNKLQTSSPPVKTSEDKEIRKSTKPFASSVDFLNGDKSFRRGVVSDDKSHNGYQSVDHNLIFNYRSEVEEEIDHKWRLDECKVMEELDEREVMEGPEETSEVFAFHLMEDAHEELAFEATKTKQDAEKMAIGILATRAFTAVELKKKLLGKKYSHEIVNALIEDFQSRGFINDFLYAESFSRSRWSSSSWGPRRIKQALVGKGVNAVDAEKATKLVFEDGESGDDQISRLGLSKPSMDHLFAQASKQWLRGRDVPSEKRKSRIIQWLQYRGFNWGVINFILKKLQIQYPP